MTPCRRPVFQKTTPTGRSRSSPIDLTSFGFSIGNRKKRPSSLPGTSSSSSPRLFPGGTRNGRARRSFAATGSKSRGLGDEEDEEDEVVIVSESTIPSAATSFDDEENANETANGICNSGRGRHGGGSDDYDENDVNEPSPLKRRKFSNGLASSVHRRERDSIDVGTPTRSAPVLDLTQSSSSEDNRYDGDPSVEGEVRVVTVKRARRGDGIGVGLARISNCDCNSEGRIRRVTARRPRRSAGETVDGGNFSNNAANGNMFGKGYVNGSMRERGEASTLREEHGGISKSMSRANDGVGRTAKEAIAIHSDGSDELYGGGNGGVHETITGRNESNNGGVDDMADSLTISVHGADNSQEEKTYGGVTSASVETEKSHWSDTRPSGLHLPLDRQKNEQEGTFAIAPPLQPFSKSTHLPTAKSTSHSILTKSSNSDNVEKCLLTSIPAPNIAGTDAFNHDNIIKHSHSNNPNVIKTIGLVRVPNHNQVACTTAVARAKSIVLPPYSHPRHPDYALHKDDAIVLGTTTTTTSDPTSSPNPGPNANYNDNNNYIHAAPPRALFPGAILGRTSSKSDKNSHFVDLGIDTKTVGISRKHLRVLTVHGWNDHRVGDAMGGGGGGGESVAERTNDGQSSLCSRSVASRSCAERTVGGCTGGDANFSVNGNTDTSVNADSHSLGRSASKASAPSLTVQVIPAANSRISTNGVNLYRTKGGIRRNVFLAQGQKCTLRVGDAIEFYSNPIIYFCVVELNILRDGVGEKDYLVDKKTVGVAVGNGVGVGDMDGGSAEGGHKKEMELEEEKECDVMKDVDNGGIHSQSEKENDIAVDNSEGATSENEKKSRSAVNSEITGTSVNVCEVKREQHEATSSVASAPKESMSSTEPNFSPLQTAEDMQDHDNDQSNDPDINQTNEIEDAALTQTMQLDPSPFKVEEEPKPLCDMPSVLLYENASFIEKGDHVRVALTDADCTGDERGEWYYGKVVSSERVPGLSPPKFKIRVELDDKSLMKFEFPHIEVQKVTRTDLDKDPEKLYIGDFVDCYYQNGGYKGGGWFRGRIASISEDGSKCDVAYHDESYEANIPTKEKKIRLIERCDETGDWLLRKKALVPHGDGFRTGIVTSVLTVQGIPEKHENGYDTSRICRVTFDDDLSDGEESWDCESTAKFVFAQILAKCPEKFRRVWPIASTATVADAVRSRRRIQIKDDAEKHAAIAVDAKSKNNDNHKSLSRRKTTAPKKRINVKVELKDQPVKSEVDDTVTTTVSEKPNAEISKPEASSHKTRFSSDSHRVKFKDDDGAIRETKCFDSQDSAFAALFDNKMKASDFPPTLPNMLWCALNSPEADTGSSFLRDLLCVHKSVPPVSMVQKLFDLMKFGPKADGCKIHFKDPHRTELASEYVYTLLMASSRLVRRDGTALFGPSSFEDLSVLLSQSMDQTANMISGRRLAHGLHLSARGAKLLSLMLSTELQDVDLSCTSVSFGALSLKSRPTVSLILGHARIHDVLKIAARNASTCLFCHSRWILECHPLLDPPSSSVIDEGCCLYAIECFDHLGSSICYIAWLFCTEEKVELGSDTCAYAIVNEFSSELQKYLNHSPEMSKRVEKQYIKMLKFRFLRSLAEEFARPLVRAIGNLFDLEDELSMIGI